MIMAFADLLRLAYGLMGRLSRTGSNVLFLPKWRIENGVGILEGIGSTDKSNDAMNMRVAHV